jgi:hypothetical protein
MKQRTQIILTIIFPLYLATVLLTNISLTGFWTDVIFSILLSILALRLVFKDKTNKLWLTITIKIVNVLCSLVVFVLLIINLTNPFAWDTLKLRGFYFQSVHGRLFNAYFKPVGAYSGGYGNFWIAEMPRYFPVIEKRVYWDRTVHHDFSDDTFDGQPIDNYEVVRSYITEEVIDQQKATPIK